MEACGEGEHVRDTCRWGYNVKADIREEDSKNVDWIQMFISVFNQLDAQNLFHIKFYFMPLHVSSTCAHHPL